MSMLDNAAVGGGISEEVNEERSVELTYSSRNAAGELTFVSRRTYVDSTAQWVMLLEAFREVHSGVMHHHVCETARGRVLIDGSVVELMLSPRATKS